VGAHVPGLGDLVALVERNQCRREVVRMLPEPIVSNDRRRPLILAALVEPNLQLLPKGTAFSVGHVTDPARRNAEPHMCGLARRQGGVARMLCLPEVEKIVHPVRTALNEAECRV